MATWTLFDEALKFMGDGTIDLDGHTFKAYLTNAAPNKGTHTVKANIAEISAGNGYSAGGQALSPTWLETGSGTGVWRFNNASFSWTAAGGAIAQFRYVVIYDDTAANDELLCYFDHGAAVDLPDGAQFLVTIGANGIFEVDATP